MVRLLSITIVSDDRLDCELLLLTANRELAHVLCLNLIWLVIVPVDLPVYDSWAEHNWQATFVLLTFSKYCQTTERFLPDSAIIS